MNTWTGMGYIGQDPETKTVGDSTVTNFSMATNEVWKDKFGQKQTRTTWHRIVAWGKQGEVIQKYFSKGDPIIVMGSIQKRDYDDKDGNKRQAVDIKMTGFEFIPQKKSEGSSQTNFQEYQRPEGVKNEAPTFDDNEPMPF